MIVISAAHLRRILTKYATYYNELRTYRSLNKDAPIHRAIQHVGSIVSTPVRRTSSPLRSGLGFRYTQLAAFNNIGLLNMGVKCRRRNGVAATK
jgi:hypothetical protein